MLAAVNVLEIDISQAQFELLHLVDLATSGQEVILTQNNCPVAKLVSIITPRQSLFGSDKGQMTLTHLYWSSRNIKI